MTCINSFNAHHKIYYFSIFYSLDELYSENLIWYSFKFIWPKHYIMSTIGLGVWNMQNYVCTQVTYTIATNQTNPRYNAVYSSNTKYKSNFNLCITRNISAAELIDNFHLIFTFSFMWVRNFIFLHSKLLIRRVTQLQTLEMELHKSILIFFRTPPSMSIP